MFPSVAFLSGTRLYGYSAGVASKDRFSFESLKSDFTILSHAILPRKSRKRADMNLFLVHQQPKTKSPSQLLPRKSGSCFGRFSPVRIFARKGARAQSLPNHLDHLLYRGVFVPPFGAAQDMPCGRKFVFRFVLSRAKRLLAAHRQVLDSQKSSP